jgi:hypothetical protein
MGGANGSRECAPDDKLRDTHHDPNDGDRFREALNSSYDLLPDGQITWAIYLRPCPAPFAKIF